MPRLQFEETTPLPNRPSSVSPATIRWIFLLLGLLAGLLLGWPLLAGDTRGQVNLLAVLMLLALLPLLTLLLSLGALLRRKDAAMRLLWQHLPLLPDEWKQRLRQWRIRGDSFWWLFYAGQWLAVGFSLGNLAAFTLLLLFTDLHFVWRSTLLQAADLQPWLEILARPWYFWETAQPTLEWLQQSRGNRLGEARALNDWWRFLLAAQLCYALLPRLLLAAWASRHLQRNLHRAKAVRTEAAAHPTPDLPGMVDQAPPGALWIDAAWLPAERAASLPTTPQPEPQDLPNDRPLVVIVRAWEPPLAELGDHLRDRHGLLLPLDWNEAGLRPPRAEHLDEWRRFAGTLGDWRVLRWSPDP